MKFSRPLLVSLAGAVLLAVGLTAGVLTLRDAPTTSADVVAGQYSLEVSAPASDATGGATFTVTASVIHDAGTPDCGADPSQFGCYQSVQWFIDYDEALIDAGPSCTNTCAAIVRVVGAPSACTSESDNDIRWAVGCLDVSGANLNYSGAVWNITANCIAPGTTTLTLVGAPSSFVTGDQFADEAFHVHSAPFECTGTAVDTPTPSPSPTGQAPTATNTVDLTPPTSTNTAVATSTIAPRNTNTATPEVEGTGTPGADTPVPGQTTVPGAPTNTPAGVGPGAGSPTSPTGAGRPTGTLRPPDTGDGSAAGADTLTWIWLSLAAVGGVLAVSGGYAAWQRRKP